MILQKLKQTAEDYLGHKVEKASSPSRRTSTTRSDRRPRTPARSPASTWSGSSRARRPSALAYGLDKKKEEKIAVYDLGGWHLRHLGARAGRGRLRGEEHQRRHPPGRRRLRPAGHRLAGDRVQEGPGHRPVEGCDGAPAAQGGRREGEDGAVELDADRNQPAVHHGRTSRAPSTSTSRSRAPSSSSWWTTWCSGRWSR